MLLVAEATTEQGVTARADITFKIFEDDSQPEQFCWKVDGDPSSKIIFERGNGPYTSVGLMLNRIHDVIAAPPGIHDISKLGPPKQSAFA